MTTASTIEDLARNVQAGNRRALARACSLVESTKAEDRDQAITLLDRLTFTRMPSRRIGVTGAPGVGKSTFVEAFGLDCIERGSRVAVLAVDPSSRRTGGSILGDKVRMPMLSNHPSAYVRPSPSRLALGGATSTTRELIVLCEAAGYDTVIVETVGVGQSEIDVADMVDMFLLLVLPTAGDDVQGIKRGIMEVADAVVVTKSDLDDMAARRATAQYTGTMRYMVPKHADWSVPSVRVSSLTPGGLHDLVDVVQQFFAGERSESVLAQRTAQRTTWFDDVLHRRLVERLDADPAFHTMLATLRRDIATGQVLPSTAVHRLLASCSITFKGPLS